MAIDVERGQQLLRAQVGKPYIFGYEVDLDDHNPLAFDCSELVEWFFHQMGYFMPDGSYNQFPATVPVEGVPQPFDLFFLLKNGKTIHHVGLVLDEFSIIHAKGEKFGVVKQNINTYIDDPQFSGWRKARCLI